MSPPQSQAQVLAALFQAHLAGRAVDESWTTVFEALDADAQEWLASLGSVEPEPADHGHELDGSNLRDAARDSMRAGDLIRAYRVRGHLEADLDPLGLVRPEAHPDLEPSSYGFGEGDLDRPIYLADKLGLDTASVREILAVVRRDYCGKIGFEFMHLQNPDQKAWLFERIEGVEARSKLKDEGRRLILEKLTEVECFERFLDRKYTGVKRFGLDGAESTIVALETVVRRGAELGIEEIVLGMAHRGRLNLLANLMQKPEAAIFHEFHGGSSTPTDIGGSGDVKYHLGASTDRAIDAHNIHLSLAPNPSHLEAVDPVVRGKVRARQRQMGDIEQTRCVPLLIHGDAAFAGQGLVAESLLFVDLVGYRDGGCIHLIINNQIGFTANPVESRSGPYCSDVAKMIQAPILHVNGDDPEAVVHAADIAVKFRQAFRRDVVIDLYCYRRFGHNEGDEPAFTQPLMYRAIKDHPSTREIYGARLIEQGLTTQQEMDRLVSENHERLQKEMDRAASWKPEKAEWLEGHWSGLEPVRGYDARRGVTELKLDVVQEIGRSLVTVPDGLNVNRKLLRQLKSRGKIFESGEGLDWSTAEALAFGSLLLEGHPIRLSGEDSTRGTFSQRHASWVDQEDQHEYLPLNHVREKQEHLEVLDSPLSEFGVLGYEYGYAMAEPRALVIWEAQFGDFANGAQVIIDQFLASGESKWLRMSGLVLLLPHGYEGQGPEHSSARIERFLQLCAEDNLQVVNCTTPASYFHALRRQMHRDFRKPLIVMAPKSLLRHKGCVSRLDDLGPGTNFHRILYEDARPSDPKDARQIVLCSGKVYYDLLEERDARGLTDVHLIRLEQLYPFPIDPLLEELTPYRHCRLVWCQEESRNMGCWSFVDELLEEIAGEAGFEHPRPRYAGRPTSASPATGLMENHRLEQAQLVDEALTVGLPRVGRLAAKRRDGSASEDT
jgi:2-oxoglutarate dehydrogenase E1 component